MMLTPEWFAQQHRNRLGPAWRWALAQELVCRPPPERYAKLVDDLAWAAVAYLKQGGPGGPGDPVGAVAEAGPAPLAAVSPAEGLPGGAPSPEAVERVRAAVAAAGDRALA